MVAADAEIIPFPRPSSPRLQQLGCPEPGCGWRGRPFAATDETRDLTSLPIDARDAFVIHMWQAHPHLRTVITGAAAQPHTEPQPPGSRDGECPAGHTGELGSLDQETGRE